MTDTPRYDIRTTMVDGKAISREIMYKGRKVDEIGEHEAVEFVMKIVSSFRFSFPTKR